VADDAEGSTCANMLGVFATHSPAKMVLARMDGPSLSDGQLLIAQLRLRVYLRKDRADGPELYEPTPGEMTILAFEPGFLAAFLLPTV
jgi:hypothetical protein